MKTPCFLISNAIASDQNCFSPQLKYGEGQNRLCFALQRTTEFNFFPIIKIPPADERATSNKLNISSWSLWLLGPWICLGLDLEWHANALRNTLFKEAARTCIWYIYNTLLNLQNLFQCCNHIFLFIKFELHPMTLDKIKMGLYLYLLFQTAEVH